MGAEMVNICRYEVRRRIGAKVSLGFQSEGLKKYFCVGPYLEVRDGEKINLFSFDFAFCAKTRNTWTRRAQKGKSSEKENRFISVKILRYCKRKHICSFMTRLNDIDGRRA